MLWIDLALAAGVALAVVAGVAFVGGRPLGDRLERRRRERLGAKNAEEERRRLEERCAACLEPIDPKVDLFDRGAWWHRRCWRDTVEP